MSAVSVGRLHGFVWSQDGRRRVALRSVASDSKDRSARVDVVVHEQAGAVGLRELAVVRLTREQLSDLRTLLATVGEALRDRGGSR